VAAETDLVRDIIDRFMVANPEIPIECACQIEAEVRAQWGGNQIYVAHNPDRHARQEAAIKAWQNGVPVRQVSAALGIDRTTVYRLLKRRDHR
jgi:transcriptional regulator of acetoin/glycerol metabolism